jgi:UDP-glucose 4-epimerase
VRRALDVPLSGHHRVLLCAADIAGTEPALVMAARFTPSVPVRDVARFRREPWRALFDYSAAARVLGWEPRYRWSTRGAEEPRL